MRRDITIISTLILLFTSMAAQGQITIGGNVYGGGNAGELSGSTNVTIYAGDINEVYGGARQADVGGRTFVNLDGKNSSDDIFIVNVYGGNDIAGTIGQGDVTTTIPDSLENITTNINNTDTTKNVIDTSWKTFVRTSACQDKVNVPVPNVGTLSIDARMLVVGNLFGGSNGDYDYETKNLTEAVYGETDPDTGEPTVVTPAVENPYYGKTAPVNSKVYLELKGGCIAHVYGGGNNATVTDATTIHIENSSDDLQKGAIYYAVKKGMAADQVTAYFQSKVHMSTFLSNLTSWSFNHARIFGGNNKVAMNITPKWNVQRGIIRDLYSGGNEGAMNSETGLLLEINPCNSNKNHLFITNVYGGCRRADVRPMSNGVEVSANSPAGYKFPKGLSARTLVRGGNIYNVYGGNDISGKVAGGNAVGIYSDILGDVYGGGNGSYAYTDNPILGEIEGPKDFYYNPGSNSVDSLNAFRPNAEQVSIRVAGTQTKPVRIRGSVYVGGNSATLKMDPNKIGNANYPKYPLVELKIGSYVTADKVFLGNNGENMIQYQDSTDVLKLYRQYVDNDLKFTDTAIESRKYNSMNLTDSTTFAEYMKGCAMDMLPSVVFDNAAIDPAGYLDYTSRFGSFYCGGNVGSMTNKGLTHIDFDKEVIIFDKLVGGCNNANVAAQTGYNAAYEGGVIGTPDSISGNKIVLNISGMRLEPKRWNADGTDLVWNTVDGTKYHADTQTYDEVEPVTSGIGTATPADLNRRLFGGNIFGGCYSSGRVNGNVVINLNGTTAYPDQLFDETAEDGNGEVILDTITHYTITKRNTGVILGQQGMDVLGEALTVYGGGKGKATEIWGSTTVNLNAGYTFQIFGGSEEGVIGKSLLNDTTSLADHTYDATTGKYAFNGKWFRYDPKYSCYVNLRGGYAGVSKRSKSNPLMSDSEFLYGGGYIGPVCGNTVLNLGNGRIFQSLAGSCNADVLGHAETYIGRMVKADYKDQMGKLGSTTENGASLLVKDMYYEDGFPWVRDATFGGNDMGGRILGKETFQNRVRSEVSDKVYNPGHKASADVLTASAYTEYLQGRVDNIFGGCYGAYDYTDEQLREFFDENGTALEGYSKPRMDNTFVNFRPTYTQANNLVNTVYGAGEGESGEVERDLLQNNSYVLIDIPQDMAYYKTMEVFGAGAFGGVGMRKYLPSKVNPTPAYLDTLDHNSAIIDLVRGQIGAAYGGSYKEGVTRRSLLNVPVGSTIMMGSIFGGAYGTNTYLPCDVYEANVNYNSSTATLIYDPASSPLYQGALYGGNNNERRTLYGRITIDVPVVQKKVIQYNDEIKGKKKGDVLMTTGTVFGAGRGRNTWSEYTEVELKSGAEVYEVYGAGQDGKVYNAESVTAFMDIPADTIKPKSGDDYYDIYKDYNADEWATVWTDAWKIGSGYDPAEGKKYWENTNTNLANPLVRVAEMDDRDFSDLTAADSALVHKRYCANVIINKGATVNNYAYGGGLGANAVVSGTTYIALLGGTVKKDIYAAGTSGSVQDAVGTGDYSDENRVGFMASANVYVEGGSCRNVYGGGWKGDVGKHTAGTFNGQPFVVAGAFKNDILGETHVIIGKLNGTSLTDGIPAIQRNVYGGGEGGPVYGSSYVKVNNGYIGYVYNPDGTDNPDTDRDEHYEEKIHDETWTDGVGLNRLLDSGCVFGAGYIDNSNVDFTNVYMFGGYVRNSIFGGGEIAAVGRGKIELGGEENSVRQLKAIFKGGKTTVEMYGGHVYRNAFAGGRGYNNLGEQGKLYSDGYVFGQTEIHIHGGEIGTDEGLLNGDGNVFGGGDIGYVYSAYQNADDSLCVGKKAGERYDDHDEGFYYKNEGGTFAANGTDGDGNYKNGTFVTNTSGGKYLTEDCKVLVEPFCKVKSPVTINVYYPKDATVSHLDMEYLKRNNISLDGKVDANGIVIADHFDISNRRYSVGEYVPAYALNTLKNKSSDSLRWICLDDAGIIIHNAVFAGGNTSAGSAAVYANATSVFGNATASIHDIYHRDLVTLGTGHTGGLYGDGNLTFIDGYRGLNITNYGTDYYNIQREIDIDTYHALPTREAAYYELRYMCVKDCTDKDGTHYTPGSDDGSGNGSKASTITADDFFTLFEGVKDGTTDLIIYDANGKKIPNPAYWKENGVCSRYAGRLMNSIQRADFCGVFGSRMVMQGAQDRVLETVDFTNYTINRVREVSLNKKQSVISSDTGDAALHGNYFGIYNIVNYLGALTSDVRFDTGVRTTDNSDTKTYGPQYSGQTFYDWKEKHAKDKTRNNGNSYNKVALASGVYLELTTEKSTGDGLYEKDWGPITGVIELDLINVQQGIGGGFVYAKNVHGVPVYNKKDNITLTALNRGAVTSDDFTYDDVPYDSTQTKDILLKEFQTSGNFVHSTQTIIDDCYNISARYKGGRSRVPAHYWYIKGSVYVYDQYISAYTGAANAYSEVVDIPLTITAASHGEMKLMTVKKNLYAYYSSPNVPLQEGKKVVINDVSYQLNDPITYWDWYMLTPSERGLFVDETYVTIADCKIGDTTYPKGTVLLPSEYNSLKNAHPTVYHVDKQEDVDFDFVFRSSNNLAHNTGYILTYDVNNPAVWDKWYTPATGDANTLKLSTAEYHKEAGYNNGPTYRLKSGAGSLLGQRSYSVSNLISKTDYDDYQTLTTAHSSVIPGGQATFEPAFIVKVDELETTKDDGTVQRFYKDATLAKSDYDNKWEDEVKDNVDTAYICKSSIKLNATDYIYINTCMTKTQKNKFKTDYPALASEIEKNVVPAYYCTSEGLYGGNYYQTGENYRGLEAWSSMSEEDRAKFIFNYDALDLLIDSTYCYGKTDGQQYQYDGADYNAQTDKITPFSTEAQARTNKAGYSLAQPVDYSATYYGDDDLPYVKDNGTPGTATKAAATELSRTEYERLLNEQRHYSPITVKDAGTYYVVKTGFIRGDAPYAVGQTISADDYHNLKTDEQANVEALTFTSAQANGTYYYCREGYRIATQANGGKSVTSVNGINTGTYNPTDSVPKGIVIDSGEYTTLVNKQRNFTIHGISPVETSTLYVSRESDIFNLSKEKIITVIYEYNYEESTGDGLNITPVSERHVVNIHITFKSGVPEVEDINKPKIVLPGTSLSLREPNVTPGAYEVTGGGWTLFDDKGDAESHINGIEYTPGQSLLYWYQNNYYIAYYAKTYLGKTYSNAVPVSVANYHDLHDVMSETNKLHHMYVDHPDVLRDSKIYINDYSSQPDTDPRKNQNGLDLLKDFFDLSLLTKDSVSKVSNGVVTAAGSLNGHALLNNHVRAERNLEFFLRSDLDHSSSAWTPIGYDDVSDNPQTPTDEGASGKCFDGVLHGDGHTISGLDHSLFAYLCGEVYNLGVKGSFTGAGIADTGDGYVENCWVMTTGTPANVKAVFGDPSRGKETQLVNCYYPQSNNYSETSNPRGNARKMPDEAFYNGEVAYDLNGFYLHKRYYDNNTSWSGTKKPYSYLPTNDDGTLPDSAVSKNYPSTFAIYQPDSVTARPAPYLGYVEYRYYDGDFQYAGGSIPDESDRRQRTATVSVLNQDNTTSQVETDVYYPVWPDDYLYFGQTLNYGHVEGREHQETPSYYMSSNRVYRAPAYFRDSVMRVAHFNPDAVFAQTKKDDASVVAYKDMTAIDFTGYRDYSTSSFVEGLATHQANGSGVWWTTGTSGDQTAFFPPLLDDGGLTSFQNVDLTRNLLVYTSVPGSSAAGKTGTVVSEYLPDEEYVETNTDYHTVAPWDSHSDAVKGHWVQYDGTRYTATLDHVLVDKQDFNAPIQYTFDDDYRMWYQRMPENYVGKLNDTGTAFIDSHSGWEGVSLPFTAELVTTDVKGEITHFYSRSKTASNSASKIGHEYWLRQFNGNVQQKKDENNQVVAGVYTADFNYPMANSDAASGLGGTKDYTNTFLWDYYYSYNGYQDANTDKYQENDEENNYYRYPREYADYPRIASAMPYIIGFPGERYYEFDLSGAFKVNTAFIQPDKLKAQAITFASKPGATIHVSDSEIQRKKASNTADNYTFTASYLNKTFPAGTAATYTLNGAGNSYDVIPAAAAPGADPVAPVTVQAFRPYFVYAAPGGSRNMAPKRIMFNDNTASLGGDEDEEFGNVAEDLFISTRPGKIVVTSALRGNTDIRIVNVGGQTVDTYTIQPGQTVESPINVSGVYIVRDTHGRHQRKLLVK